MLRTQFQNFFRFCFSPSTKMSNVPHYILDILHEDPFKTLHVIDYELFLGKITSTIFLVFFLYSSDKIPQFFYCNWMISSWFFMICVLNLMILLPRFLISFQIKRIKSFLVEGHAEEGFDLFDMVRNLLWDQIFQTKIYYFTQKILNYISRGFVLGIFLLIVDSAEFGLGKACQEDKILKKMCILVVLMNITKFYLLKKKMMSYKNYEEMSFQDLKERKEIDEMKEIDVCSICLLDFRNEEKIHRLKCKHFFHKICIQDWRKVKKKCPLCGRF